MSVKASYLFLIILAVAAGLIVFVAVRAYNRRLDRIANGELRDTHSSVPEPKTAIGVTYRTVLMAVVVISFMTLSAASSRLMTMQSAMNNLQSNVNHLQNELSTLHEAMDRSNRLVARSYWEILNADWDKRTGEVEFTAELRAYSADTSVSLLLNGRDIPLSQVSPGVCRARFTASLFESFTQPTIHITEGGRTTVEECDFPETLFWDYLPMPMFTCRFNSDTVVGKMKYDGEYTIITDHPEDIASVKLTYLTGGKALKALDLTAETIAGQKVVLEEGLPLEKDLTFLVEIVTKSGLRIVDQSVMIYEASPDFEDTDFLRIEDADGNILWEEDRK